jgi:hypothetical protein
VSRVLSILAALLLFVGAAIHSISYPKVVKVIDASNLTAQFAGAYKGLWLSDSVLLTVVGAVFLIGGIWPGRAASSAVGGIIVLLLGCACALYMTMGAFPPAHLLVAAAILGWLAQLKRSNPPRG